MKASTIITWLRTLYIYALSLFGKEKLPTNYPMYCRHVSDVISVIEGQGVKFVRKDEKRAEDIWFFYTDLAHLKEIAPYLTTIFSEYHKFAGRVTDPDENGDYGGVSCKEVPDCDEYALNAVCKAAFKFGISMVKFMGTIPKEGTNELALHAWAGTMVGRNKFVFIEPNLGFPWAGIVEPGEHGYIAKTWLIP